ncbi:NAD(P)H-dependent oxidoreductase [Arachidicoccus ginsenosidimutans]|uniref:nitroreductase family protein n=1 Tax=Arachidicoccus sp. BS20 TaxID=1850526 RepID=UPI0007F08E68|nr:nitroreductase family protein [Arachidicoccus sp. BS20]ANI88669.1 NAD(P)H-dependent oxidoreductase [Arachidicoccus sp. BS20]
MSATLDALQWRYATKKMNGTAVEQPLVDEIIEAARLAPTSSGLQPFSIIEITDAELKKKIQPIANNQSQIVDASHLLIFAAWDNYTEERINERFARIAAERELPLSTVEDYKNRLIAGYVPRSAEVNFQHAARQAYIAFGAAIVAAAELKVDTTPMEGFKNDELDELLELSKYGLKSVTILAIGYRDTDNDWLVNLKKVRVPTSELVIKLP